MTGWWLPLVAFAAMACQDMLGSRLMQAEASYRPHLAAAMDTAQDVAWIAGFWAIGDSLFVPHDPLLSAATVAARLAADYSGTYSGVRLGALLDRRKETDETVH